MFKNKEVEGNVFTHSPHSYWIASTDTPKLQMLTEETTADVVIIGGGMVGITTAYLLKDAGLKIIILEGNRLLEGVTGHTTAKLTSQHKIIYAELIKKFGQEKAQMYADANQQAIEKVASIVEDRKIDCDFSRQRAYVYTRSEDYIKQLEKEVQAAQSLGIPASFESKIDLPFSIKGAECFENQAQFHVRKYLLALVEEIQKAGVQIFEHSRVIDVEGGSPYKVITQKGSVHAAKVVVASHYPVQDRFGFYFSRMYTERSYILGLKVKEKFSGGMYITAETPTHSFRSQATEDGELVLLAGEGHKTGQGGPTHIHYKRLLEYAQEVYDVQSVPYRWSAQDCYTVDGVPYIGQLTAHTPHMYVATGFFKWGMTNSTAAGIILSDLLQEKENSWLPVFDSLRFTPKESAKDFIVQNANVAQQFVGGKIYRPLADQEDLAHGEGRIIECNDQKVGAYRDETGQLHIVDPICPHMGCQLSWNEAERTWDCPCHGSRYTYEGEVIEGPAVHGLTKIEIE